MAGVCRFFVMVEMVETVDEMWSYFSFCVFLCDSFYIYFFLSLAASFWCEI